MCLSSQAKKKLKRKEEKYFVPIGEINVMRAMRRGISLRKEPEAEDSRSSF